MDDVMPDTRFPLPPAPGLLVVDDEPSIRLPLRLFLEEEGYQVAEASSVTEAHDHLRAAAFPHIVLLDFRMPHGDADILLHAVDVDADGTLQRHRYVLTPASQITLFPEDAQRLIRAHCAAVVYKPFDLTKLLTAIKRAEAQLPPH